MLFILLHFVLIRFLAVASGLVITYKAVFLL